MMPTACAIGRSTSSSKVEARAPERAAMFSNCETPKRADAVICENAASNSSTRVDVRRTSSISAGTSASEAFVVSISLLV